MTKQLFLLGLLSSPVLAADTGVPSAKTVTAKGPMTPAALAKAVKEQSGIDLDVSALDDKPVPTDFDKAAFWTVVDKLAERTGSRVFAGNGRVALKSGKSQASSSVTGPFRFSVREILVRGDAEAGTSHYTVIVGLAWEPWLHTYRIDTVPKITQATDDTGTVTVATGGTRTFTSGNTAELAVRPQEVRRSAKTLSFTGSVMVTIADELLTFTFDAAGKPGPAPAQKGVTATATKFGPDGTDWVVDVETDYPKGGAVWESYEFYWARNNTLELVPPKGDRIKSDSMEFRDGAIRYVFRNRAKQVGKGWKFDYRTPGPMREVVVPFELKDIRLP